MVVAPDTGLKSGAQCFVEPPKVDWSQAPRKAQLLKCIMLWNKVSAANFVTRFPDAHRDIRAPNRPDEDQSFFRTPRACSLDETK